MSKKNVALVLLIVCFLTIMVIGVFGNAAITGIFTNVQEVSFIDKNGIEVLEDENGNYIVEIDYDEENFSEEVDEEEVTHKMFTYEYYAVVKPKDASYPQLFIALDEEVLGVSIEVSGKLEEWPFDGEEEGVVYIVKIKIDSSIIKIGSCSIRTRIDENKNTVSLNVPNISFIWDLRSLEEISGGEELE